MKPRSSPQLFERTLPPRQMQKPNSFGMTTLQIGDAIHTLYLTESINIIAKAYGSSAHVSLGGPNSAELASTGNVVHKQLLSSLFLNKPKLSLYLLATPVRRKHKRSNATPGTLLSCSVPVQWWENLWITLQMFESSIYT